MCTQVKSIVEIGYNQPAQHFWARILVQIDEELLEPFDLCVISKVSDVLPDLSRDEL
jgi:hypothetical protein